MRQIEIPAKTVIAPHETVPATVFRRAQDTPDETLALRRNTAGEWEEVSCANFAQEVTQVATMLIDAGVQVGDRVCIMGNTSYVWALMDYGILAAGAITVPIYETDSADQIDFILISSNTG